MKYFDLFPYPIKSENENKIIDGTFVQAPLFCKRNFNNKCLEHYSNIDGKKGIHTCPYGFVSDVIFFESKEIIITGLNIEKLSNRKSLKKYINKKDFSPKITFEYYTRTKNNFLKIIKEKKEIELKHKEYKEGQKSLSENIEILNNTFHELRKLNRQLKKQSENLSYELEKYSPSYERLKYLGLNIFATSRLISIRLNTFDFTQNPELVSHNKKRPTKVFKKIEKVIHCLNVEAVERNVRVKIEGNSYSSIEANDIFELLPYLLLENALKYTPKHEKIIVRFSEDDKNIFVRIKNLGPRPDDKEIPHLTKRGIRSSNVTGIENGQGLGLYLSNYICEIHDIDMSIKIGNNRKYINDKVYSDFIVDLVFNNLFKDNE